MDDIKGKAAGGAPASDIRLTAGEAPAGRERTLAVALAVEQAHSAGLAAENRALRAKLAEATGRDAPAGVEGVYETAFDLRATSFGLPAGLGSRAAN